jgi:GNAT superfamily N-acetyltransferase
MKFEIADHPTTEDLDFLTQKINEEAPPEYGKAHGFAIFLSSAEGSVLAGCNGSILFGEIYTDMLWVHPIYRGKGLSRQLMELMH